MRIFNKLFKSIKKISNEELINCIKSGGTHAAKGIAIFYDVNLPKAAKMKIQKYPSLTDDDFLFAYSTAVTQLVAIVEKDEYNNKAKLSTLLIRIFDRRCIDLLRKQKSRGKKMSIAEYKESPYLFEDNYGEIDSSIKDAKKNKKELHSSSEDNESSKRVINDKVAIVVNIDPDKLPEVKDESCSVEDKMISREFINEMIKRLGKRKWNILLYKEDGFTAQQIADEFKFKTPNSATQSCYLYRSELNRIIQVMRREGHW